MLRTNSGWGPKIILPLLCQLWEKMDNIEYHLIKNFDLPGEIMKNFRRDIDLIKNSIIKRIYDLLKEDRR